MLMLFTIKPLSHFYYIIAGSSTPQDTGTSKQESPSGDEEQNTTVHGPNPGPGKHGSKDDVTCKSSRGHGLIVWLFMYISLHVSLCREG